MALTHPLSSLPPEAATSFPGQQEGERILYMIRPSWTREIFGDLKALLVAGAAGALWWYLAYSETIQSSEEHLMRNFLVLGVLVGIFMLWWRQYCEQSRAYITDRRFVRFEGAFPSWQSQRSLFWSDVVKTRTIAPNFFMKLLNIGTIEVMPNFAVEGQNIIVHHVYMYGDIAAYLDKIVYTFRNKNAEMASIREFVPKPKGKRY